MFITESTTNLDDVPLDNCTFTGRRFDISAEELAIEAMHLAIEQGGCLPVGRAPDTGEDSYHAFVDFDVYVPDTETYTEALKDEFNEEPNVSVETHGGKTGRERVAEVEEALDGAVSENDKEVIVESSLHDWDDETVRERLDDPSVNVNDIPAEEIESAVFGSRTIPVGRKIRSLHELPPDTLDLERVGVILHVDVDCPYFG